MSGIVSVHDLGGRRQVPGKNGGVIRAHRVCSTINATDEHQCLNEQDHAGSHRCLCGHEWWWTA